MSEVWKDLGNAVEIPKKEPAAFRVQWAFKTWDQFTDSDKIALDAHLTTLVDEKAKTYRKYLNAMCGVPWGAMGGNNVR